MIDRTVVAGVLLASLMGSVHCAAMCGPFTCLYAGSTSRGAPASGNWSAHAAYNLGRLVSYLALGGVAGAIGLRLDGLGQLRGVAHLAAIVAGALMTLWAGAAIAAVLGVHVPVTLAPEWLRAGIGRVLMAARSQSARTRALLVGLLTTLLPCGWLYVFVAVAGGTGTVAAGAAVMVAFWAGTLPMMVAVGSGAGRLLGPLARRLPLASAALVLVLGLLSVAGKLHAPASPAHTHGVGTTAGGPAMFDAMSLKRANDGR